ncbi:hypothetical protein HanXRQr2_Chr09g0382601 [Helianthus annuus]|uniref:Uncharacterized protein n=1 Tax=Helianthus annuus TaxID=4232 RepID=A0A9K3N7W4_HELAN|nr:hypothetical protein HanXRQr2_Chr09g0382601 [Helianthus annuus]KAJ0892668.1 hypothetical protein HanPSC8_Chr09g0368631 [Helianthus annuus]
MCCFHCWKSLKVMSIATYNVSIETPSKLECDKNLSQYLMQLMFCSFKMKRYASKQYASKLYGSKRYTSIPYRCFRPNKP